MYFLYRSTSFCIPVEKKLSGWSRSQVCTASFTSSSEVNLPPRNDRRCDYRLAPNPGCKEDAEEVRSPVVALSLLSLLLYEDVHCHDAVRRFWRSLYIPKSGPAAWTLRTAFGNILLHFTAVDWYYHSSLSEVVLLKSVKILGAFGVS